MTKQMVFRVGCLKARPNILLAVHLISVEEDKRNNENIDLKTKTAIKQLKNKKIQFQLCYYAILI